MAQQMEKPKTFTTQFCLIFEYIYFGSATDIKQIIVGQNKSKRTFKFSISMVFECQA